MKAIINSVKHYVHIPVAVVTSGARTSFQLVKATVAPATGAASEVREGSTVKAIYLELWVSGVTADKTGNGLVMKVVGNSAVPSFAEMQNLGAYGQKKNILATHQGLMPTGGNIVPLFREWIKIPRGKQRMGLGDFVFTIVSGTATNVNVCGFATYKEYF